MRLGVGGGRGYRRSPGPVTVDGLPAYTYTQDPDNYLVVPRSGGPTVVVADRGQFTTEQLIEIYRSVTFR